LKNITAPIAIIELLAEHLQLPFTKEEFFDYGKKMIVDVSMLISESNTLAEFWRTMEYLADRSEIVEGSQYKIEVVSDVNLLGEKDSTFKKTFDEPKKLLYIRLNIVHNLFAKEFKSKSGKGAPGLETIRLYMKDQAYWIGNSPSSRFKENGKDKNTSCIVLDYDMLKVNLETLSDDSPEDRKEITIEGSLLKDAEMVGKVVKFTLTTAESSGFPTKTTILYYTCYVQQAADQAALKERMNVKVTGLLSEKRKQDRVYRTVDVTEWSLSSLIPSTGSGNGAETVTEDMPF
jgi:hypothetical protein